MDVEAPRDLLRGFGELQGLLPPGAVEMQRAGYQLLAGSALTLERYIQREEPEPVDRGGRGQ